MIPHILFEFPYYFQGWVCFLFFLFLLYLVQDLLSNRLNILLILFLGIFVLLDWLLSSIWLRLGKALGKELDKSLLRPCLINFPVKGIDKLNY